MQSNNNDTSNNYDVTHARGRALAGIVMLAPPMPHLGEHSWSEDCPTRPLPALQELTALCEMSYLHLSLECH